MVDKLMLKQVMVSNRRDVEGYRVNPRQLPPEGIERLVLIGARRAGKSFMMYQRIQHMLRDGHGWNEIVYLNFEDDRLVGFSLEDFEKILECHAEISDQRPALFLDEVQNIDGWEQFARRIADQKYFVWITGSNQKMLSSEIMSTLGGRYLTQEVYPYSFKEYLNATDVTIDAVSQYSRDVRGRVVRSWDEYLAWGGLPEALEMPVKRDYLSSTFQKIYLGDICARNKIASPDLLRLMLKKLAESVRQPVSYNRLANVLSSVSGKITMPTVSKYIEHSEAAWLLLRLRNISAQFSEKESNCKYYFVDNGLLNLFLLGGETALLENVVAVELFRRYGHDKDHETVFFYNDRVEVDFYIPDDRLAIQVSYSISQSGDTYEREVDALRRLPKVQPCEHRTILTYNEQDTLTDEFGIIEVIPAWRWLLGMNDA